MSAVRQCPSPYTESWTTDFYTCHRPMIATNVTRHSVKAYAETSTPIYQFKSNDLKLLPLWFPLGDAGSARPGWMSPQVQVSKVHTRALMYTQTHTWDQRWQTLASSFIVEARMDLIHRRRSFTSRSTFIRHRLTWNLFQFTTTMVVLSPTVTKHMDNAYMLPNGILATRMRGLIHLIVRATVI